MERSPGLSRHRAPGHAGAAARKLKLSQPTMGRRLKALADAVGQKRFQGTSEGFVLTDEGAAVLSHAEHIEEEALAFERELRGLTLRLSCSDWFGVHVLAPIIAEFAAVQPNVVVELLTDARLYSLSRREADLVFHIQPFDDPEVIAR
jgi:DNA-binding transcriptional LysR family regulator